MNRTPMTLKGIEKLRKELEDLKIIKRPRIVASIAEARKHGDLKENAEYFAAREEQGFCEGRIQEIELKLSNAQIIDVTKIPHNGRVVFGATVSILHLDTNEQSTWCIVGDDEANYKQNLISIHSPMARGLIGREVNDVVVIKTPRGNVKYKILQIEYL